MNNEKHTTKHTASHYTEEAAEHPVRHTRPAEASDPHREKRPVRKAHRSTLSGMQIFRAAFLAVLVIGCLVCIHARWKADPGLLSGAAVKVSGSKTAGEAAAATAEPAEAEATPEPEPEYFTISAIGDLTLASHQNLSDASEYSYTKRMNGDYTYPFQNTIQYFESDDLTIGNLECTFSDRNLTSSSLFYFRAPADRANILTVNSIDFVTIANNHTMDFGETGYNNTCAALDAVGAKYGSEGQTQIITTDSGLKVGIYTTGEDAGSSSSWLPDHDDAIIAIHKLQSEGAEYIIVMFHWGKELQYIPSDGQKELAHACIDAGANLVYGTHPHCLEPVEEYNGGIILYSMGNFSFGGNTDPTDWDTAIVQISVKKTGDGTVTNEGWTAIPCRCSENTKVNDYKPTPYDKETNEEDYARIMSKLLGTYDGTNTVKDYSSWYASYT